ncbi:ion transporter [Gammaproteobacteria bacterium]|nr:ion transporter [Gammaproteobacteria bacterium]
MTTRRKVYHLIEAGLPHREAIWFDGLIIVLIVINVAAVILSTVESATVRYAGMWMVINIGTAVIFSIEYLLRLWVAPEHPHFRRLSPAKARLRYALRPVALIDLIALLPSLLTFFTADFKWLRMLRLLRLLKLWRWSPAIQSIGRVVYRERSTLLGWMLIAMMMLIAAGSMIYFAEHEAQPAQFGSIVDGMWWAIATLTTVGYGDLTPITGMGRLIGGMVMLTGLGLFAVPIGVIAGGLAEELKRRDFVISWGLIARVPFF